MVEILWCGSFLPCVIWHFSALNRRKAPDEQPVCLSLSLPRRIRFGDPTSSSRWSAVSRKNQDAMHVDHEQVDYGRRESVVSAGSAFV